ncbi:MAG: aldo/keto reductase [Casimicrobiaceae bacterium]
MHRTDPTARVRIGRTALEVTRLGFGSAPLGGLLRATSEDDAEAAVAAALEAGIGHFDVAPQYGGGLAERRLGRALRKTSRDRFVVSTKVGKLVQLNPAAPPQTVGFVGAPAHDIEYDYSYDGVRRSVEASLERLGLDRVDLLFIHDVNRKYHGDRVHERLEEALDGACRALMSLRGQGTIKAFGPATKDLDIAGAFVERADIDCLMLPARCTLLDQSSVTGLFPICAARNVSVLAAAPFESGILATGAIAGATYDYRPAPPEVLDRVRAIESLCARFQVPLAAAALQFPLQFPVVASMVTGMRSAAEVRQNLEWMRAPIPAAFWTELGECAGGRAA